MIEISIDSSFEGYSHYNTIVMCGGFNASGEQLYVESARKGEGVGEGEQLTRLSVEDAHRLEVIIYIIPKSTPAGKNIEITDHPPFEAHITIKQGERLIDDQRREINAWGGAAIKLNFEI